jgi:hypothetical protein
LVSYMRMSGVVVRDFIVPDQPTNMNVFPLWINFEVTMYLVGRS